MELKSFLSESFLKEYYYRVKIAHDCGDAQMEQLERCLSKYNPESIAPWNVRPLEENPIEFTRSKHVEFISEVSSTDIVSKFINDYKPYQNLIIGLLIIAELKKAGINITEKDAVRNEIQSLVSPQGGTGLTERGTQLLNHYASGGFEHIRDARSTKPESRDEFMLDFIDMVERAAEELR